MMFATRDNVSYVAALYCIVAIVSHKFVGRIKMSFVISDRSRSFVMHHQSHGAVDILAFQDGQVDYQELYDYLVVNKKLADRYGMKCWTNIESFDRDMPIRFLPIKWEKLLLKLEAARKAGMENAITFEFSHFMSPNSSYSQAGHLYNRYLEHFNIKRG